MSNLLWAIAIVVPIGILGLWMNLGRPPKVVTYTISAAAWAYFGLIFGTIVAAIAWSFFA
jgi:hypothetical protein